MSSENLDKSFEKLSLATEKTIEDGVKTGLLFDPKMCLHEDDESHVECPQRITSIYNFLKSQGLDKRCVEVNSREIKEEEILLVHTKEHYLRVKSWNDMKQSDLDIEAAGLNSIYINQYSSFCADLSAGSVVEMTEMVLKGQLNNGVVICRPPGHHAEPNCAMGFCFYNNVGIAAAVAKSKYGIKKIAIVDWDVHHGNATQTMFYQDPSVLFFSLHRFDHGTFYPCQDSAGPKFIGEGEGKGKNVNIAWNSRNIKDSTYLSAFDRVLLPILKEYQPELIIISAGFDSAEGDPLGKLSLSPAGYSQMTSRLTNFANGKIVVALEGGYNLKSISYSMSAVVSTLLGDTPLEVEDSPIDSKCRQSIEETISAHKPYWKYLI